jgi:hypothetical protein
MAKVWFITGTSKGRIATWEEWEPLSVRAHGQTQLTIEEN